LSIKTNSKPEEIVKIEKLCKLAKQPEEQKMVKQFNKSLSNISTTSIESGIFDMDDWQIGDAIKQILTDAQQENRIICGLNKTLEYLTVTEHPEHSLFMFIAPSDNSDALTHMAEVLISAFCLDKDIYIVKVDSAEKLNRILGSDSCGTCALVQRSASLDLKTVDDEIDLEKFTALEDLVVDHCEDVWGLEVEPIRLPEK
jgi:growth arrest and DNA-damage-inducible protein